MLASTLNTNQLGYDPDRAAASLEVGDRAARILFLKNVAIALILARVILGISVVLRFVIHNQHSSIGLSLIRDVGVMATWLGIGSLVSALLPFRPMGWRARWRARSTWSHFALCITLPYVLLYGLLKFWLLPEIDAANALFGSVRHERLGYELFAMGWGLATWGLGLALAKLWSRHEGERIVHRLRPAVAVPGSGGHGHRP